MNNIRQRSLEILEREAWPAPKQYTSRLVERCHQLRKVPIGELTVENLRLLISQDIGTVHLVPLAIEILQNDPLAEGDFYPGDLLKSVLAVNEAYWNVHAEQRAELLRIAERVRGQLP